MSNPPKPLRLFLFSHPRTNSHLFMKLLGSHPAISPKAHPFALPQRLSVESLWKDADEHVFKPMFTQFKEYAGRELTWQTEFDQLLSWFKDCEDEKKIALVDEHAHYCWEIMDPYRSAATEYRPTMKIVVTDTRLDLPLDLVNEETPTGPIGPPISNPTCFPDQIWRSFSPIFIIRHPARTVSSYFRGMKKLAPTISPESERNHFDLDYRWPKILFDAYRDLYQNHLDPDVLKTWPYPIVVDGTDIVNDPENVMTKLCDIIGIDPSGISYKWDPDMTSGGPIMDIFLGTLRGSSGVIKSDKPLDDDPDIEEEGKKWKEEFGEHTGGIMIKLAQSIMPDYKYLWQFRLQ